MSYVVCNQCPGMNNNCYITGWNTKCGHDNGYAYTTTPLTNQISEQSKQISENFTKISDFTNKNNELTRKLAEAEKKFTNLTNQNNTLTTKSTENGIKITDLTNKNNELTKKSADNEKQITTLTDCINQLKNKCSNFELSIIEINKQKAAVENELAKNGNENLKKEKEITELNQIIVTLKDECSGLKIEKNNLTSTVESLNLKLNELNKEICSLKENPIENLIENVFKKVECNEIVSFINSTQFEELVLTICPLEYKKKIENEITGITSKFKFEITSKISNAINNLDEVLKSKLLTCEENIEKLTSQLKAANIPLKVIDKSVEALTDYQKELKDKIESLSSLKEKFLFNINDF